MDNDNFYIDLPSDASLLQHPENHGGKYTVELPNTLSLISHQWEAALVEIVFQRDWETLIASDIWVAFCINDTVGGGWSKCSGKTAAKADQLQTWHYKDFADFWGKVVKPLIDEAAKQADLMGAHSEAVAMTVDSGTKRVWLKMRVKSKTGMPVRLELSHSLLQMLGFNRSQLKLSRYFQSDAAGAISTGYSHFSPDFSRGISSLWVYSNIVKPHIAGHGLSPLLRIISVGVGGAAASGGDGTESAARIISFPQAHYYPLLLDDLSAISIYITNSGGLEAIKFATPVICKLHFRRRRSRIGGGGI
jgi:hypothetical protein